MSQLVKTTLTASAPMARPVWFVLDQSSHAYSFPRAIQNAKEEGT